MKAFPGIVASRTAIHLLRTERVSGKSAARQQQQQQQVYNQDKHLQDYKVGGKLSAEKYTHAHFEYTCSIQAYMGLSP